MRHSDDHEERVLATISIVSGFVFILCGMNCTIGFNFAPFRAGRSQKYDLTFSTEIPRSYVLKEKLLFDKAET
jgi:hypothetical protein